MSGLLGIPLGPKGSARARYGAAMGLYAEGRLTPAQLEAYRTAAAEDATSPAQVFAERGLPLPPESRPMLETLFRNLITEADLYLSTLLGPGVAEVRAGIARWRDGPVTFRPRANAVIETHLPEALHAVEGQPALVAALAAVAPHLDWITYDRYPLDAIGPGFAQGHAYASLIGEEGTIRAQDFDLGVFLIAPNVLYRDHHHPAPELYAPLTGPHGWRFGPGTPLIVKPAHQPVWNPANRPHMTKVGPRPFLCLFGWTADVTLPAKVIPAADWAELEGLRL